MTERSPTGRLTLWDQREAGTWVHRLREEARSGTTDRSPMGRLTLWDQREAGTQVYRSGTDGVVRGHWTCYLQMVCGTINVYVLYVYSTEPVLSAELC